MGIRKQAAAGEVGKQRVDVSAQRWRRVEARRGLCRDWSRKFVRESDRASCARGTTLPAARGARGCAYAGLLDGGDDLLVDHVDHDLGLDLDRARVVREHHRLPRLQLNLREHLRTEGRTEADSSCWDWDRGFGMELGCGMELGHARRGELPGARHGSEVALNSTETQLDIQAAARRHCAIRATRARRAPCCRRRA
jgi:hypothetical protein